MNKPVSLRERQAPVQTQQGFTLVELLITMVIVSILAAIAIPSYSSYIQRSRRTDAKSALLDLASLEERYFSTNNTYTNLPTNLGYTAGAGVAFPVGSGYYNITTLTATLAVAPLNATSAGTPATYTIIATPVAGNSQANDTACASFTVTSAGQQTALNSAGVDNSVTCWK
jgi:type IV pilus assembly protein PilE